jgi:ABC-2 type transport system permease protein
MPASRQHEHVVTSVPSLRRRIGEIVRYRELLVNLVRKELKVKYKNSSLGFAWSMLNPALYLVVFYVVFQLILGSGIPDFAIYLLSGLLVWNLFSTGLSAATGSVVANGGLIKKVSFPREILPLASIGAALVHFFLQTMVLALALMVFRHSVGQGYLLLLPLALLTILLLVTALGTITAAVNVYMRDTEHLVELVLLAWFWMTPIVYPFRLVADKLADSTGSGSFALVNPVTAVVIAFQRAIYNRDTGSKDGALTAILPDAGIVWYLRNLGVVAAVSLVLLALGLRLFGRLEGNFAEEL